MDRFRSASRFGVSEHKQGQSRATCRLWIHAHHPGIMSPCAPHPPLLVSSPMEPTSLTRIIRNLPPPSHHCRQFHCKPSHQPAQNVHKFALRDLECMRHVTPSFPRSRKACPWCRTALMRMHDALHCMMECRPSLRVKPEACIQQCEAWAWGPETCAHCLLLSTWLALLRHFYTAYQKLVQNNLAPP
jgi:hypothetical protein